MLRFYNFFGPPNGGLLLVPPPCKPYDSRQRQKRRNDQNNNPRIQHFGALALLRLSRSKTHDALSEEGCRHYKSSKGFIFGRYNKITSTIHQIARKCE